MQGFSLIDFAVDGMVARLRLRRPPLNILDVATIAEIRRALGSLGALPSVRALVLSAEGKAFSAGVSVEEHLPGTVRDMIESFHDVFRLLRRVGLPSIAAVQGAALGGGCELACFADFVIAAEGATFGVPEIRLGVFPPIAAVHFPTRVGAARAAQLILSGAVLDAAEAARIGLVDRVVPPEQLDAAVEAELAKLRDKSAVALRLARRAAAAGAEPDFEARLREVERLYLDELMRTADAAEGLRAFLEKRPPRWSS